MPTTEEFKAMVDQIEARLSGVLSFEDPISDPPIVRTSMSRDQLVTLYLKNGEHGDPRMAPVLLVACSEEVVPVVVVKPDAIPADRFEVTRKTEDPNDRRHAVRLTQLRMTDASGSATGEITGDACMPSSFSPVATYVFPIPTCANAYAVISHLAHACFNGA
jgi:hypothetical protein